MASPPSGIPWGTRVRITVDDIGVLDSETGAFVDDVILNAGDEGTYAGPTAIAHNVVVERDGRSFIAAVQSTQFEVVE